MTANELKAFHDWLLCQQPKGSSSDYLKAMAFRLVAEVERLRGLIADVIEGTSGICPWCGHGAYKDEPHPEHCPAFTPDGEVK